MPPIQPTRKEHIMTGNPKEEELRRLDRRIGEAEQERSQASAQYFKADKRLTELLAEQAEVIAS